MAILTGDEINKQVELGGVAISPFDPTRTGANSYDLKMASKLRIYAKFSAHQRIRDYGFGSVAIWFYDLIFASNFYFVILLREFGALILALLLNRKYQRNTRYRPAILDIGTAEPTVELEIPEEGRILWPGILYLGTTEEFTESAVYVPCIEGRSSVARMGISIHSSAGFGDVGFRGAWTLEVTVTHPVIVYPNRRMCQIFYLTTEGELGRRYQGKYQGQREPEPSRMFQDNQ